MSRQTKPITESGFAAGLLDIDEGDAARSVSEVRASVAFRAAMDAKQRQPGGRRLPRASVNGAVGTVLYAICRQLQPADVVETGVASGVSSSYVLGALAANGRGRLHSIDFPTWEPDTGWIVPDILKDRWELIIGRRTEELTALLKRLGTLQVFFHDGEHTYDNMMWEYRSAWAALEPGGVLLSHNIDFTDAFPDFSESIGVTSWVFQNLGGLRKAK